MSTEIRSVLAHGRIGVDFSMMDVLGHVIIWTLISIFTAGIGLFFWPYASSKFIINNIILYDHADARVGRLQCNLSAGSQIGHIVLWIFISMITAGLAFPFYMFGVVRTALNRTTIL